MPPLSIDVERCTPCGLWVASETQSGISALGNADCLGNIIARLNRFSHYAPQCMPRACWGSFVDQGAYLCAQIPTTGERLSFIVSFGSRCL